MDPAHYAGLRQGLPKTRTLLEAAFRRRFPDHEWFLEGVFIQHPPQADVAHLRAILGLAELYSSEALLGAFATARTYTTYSHRFIRGLLEAQGTPQLRLLPIEPAPRPTDPIGADLTVYQRLLEANR